MASEGHRDQVYLGFLPPVLEHYVHTGLANHSLEVVEEGEADSRLEGLLEVRNCLACLCCRLTEEDSQVADPFPSLEEQPNYLALAVLRA